MARKEDPSSKEAHYTNPEPFNHGTASINYLEVPISVREQLSDMLKKGWSVDGISSIGQAYSQAEISSNNFRVISDSGNYLLKLSNINSPANQEIVTGSILFCKENGVLVPTVIPTPDGSKFSVVDGKVFCLFDFIDGEHFDGSQVELLDVASQLPKFNEVLAAVPLEESIQRSKGTIVQHDWQTLGRIIQMVRTNRKISRFDQEVSEIADEVEKESNSLRSGRVGDLPFQVVHTDLHPHNLLFDKKTKKLMAFIDFDSLEFTQRIRSVAFAMHRVARTFGNLTERKSDSGADMGERAKLFIDHYAEVGGLNSEEIGAIPMIVKDEALRRVVIVLNEHYLKGHSQSDYDFRKQLVTLREAKFFEDFVG